MTSSFAAILGTVIALASGGEDQGRPNVLLIISDDLRPQLGCYGDPVVRSPELDTLALDSLRFDRAYCQAAVCSPSRNSFLSGLRPATTGLYGFGTSIREAMPDVVTLPQHFKSHGYHTSAVGKVFHLYSETLLGSEDDPASWSRPLILPTRPVWGPEQEVVRHRLIAEAEGRGDRFEHPHDWPRANAWEAPEVADEALQDGEIASIAIDLMRERARSEEPWFLAVGFLKPHLPFVAPKRYWDLYREDELELPLNQVPPIDAPPFALIPGPDRLFANVPKSGPIDEAFKRRFLHAYLACISYVDAQVGRVVRALDDLGLRERTVVVFLGDHGYQMGEHGAWGNKHSNYETSTRVPLLVSAPGMTVAGRSTDALVELVDLYPTLADLAGLPIPAMVEGSSFRPLLVKPACPWKKAAFSETLKMRRKAEGGPPIRLLGTAIRTDRERYVEWVDGEGTVVARELYDHRVDPGENRNIAADPEHAVRIESLSNRLRSGWRAALPSPIP